MVNQINSHPESPGLAANERDNEKRACDNEGTRTDITFFVACYNEEENIIQTLEEIVAAVHEACCSYEIIIIDDASTDRSVEKVEKFQQEHPEIPLFLNMNRINKGLAYNYTEAAFLGKGKFFRLISGDNVEKKDTIISHLAKMGEADIVLTMPTRIEGRPLKRRILSKFFIWIINLFSGYKLGYWNGPVTHCRNNVMRWHSNTRGFGYQAQLIHQLLVEGCSFTTVSGHFHDRQHGKATALTFKNFFAVLHSIVSILVYRIELYFYRSKKRDEDSWPRKM